MGFSVAVSITDTTLIGANAQSAVLASCGIIDHLWSMLIAALLVSISFGTNQLNASMTKLNYNSGKNILAERRIPRHVEEKLRYVGYTRIRSQSQSSPTA